MVPSGVMYESCTPVIGSGCVIDFEVLKNEIETLNGKNIDTTKLKLSYNAHIIMPYHKILDELIEDSLGDKKIGTTRKRYRALLWRQDTKKRYTHTRFFI